jgi:hypothetical protein
VTDDTDKPVQITIRLAPLERTPLPLDDPARELPHPIRRFLGRD